MISVMLLNGKSFIAMFHLKIGFVERPFEFKKSTWINQWGKGIDLDFNTPVIALGLAFEIMNPAKQPPPDDA